MADTKAKKRITSKSICTGWSVGRLQKGVGLPVQDIGSFFDTRLCTFPGAIDDDDVNHWPEVLKFLFECCSLNHPQLYESALRIIR